MSLTALKLVTGFYNLYSIVMQSDQRVNNAQIGLQIGGN